MLFFTTRYLRHNHKLAEVTLYSKPSGQFLNVLDDKYQSLEVIKVGPGLRSLHVEGREWEQSDMEPMDQIHSYRLL